MIIENVYVSCKTNWQPGSKIVSFPLRVSSFGFIFSASNTLLTRWVIIIIIVFGLNELWMTPVLQMKVNENVVFSYIPPEDSVRRIINRRMKAHIKYTSILLFLCTNVWWLFFTNFKNRRRSSIRLYFLLVYKFWLGEPMSMMFFFQKMELSCDLI